MTAVELATRSRAWGAWRLAVRLRGQGAMRLGRSGAEMRRNTLALYLRLVWAT